MFVPTRYAWAFALCMALGCGDDPAAGTEEFSSTGTDAAVDEDAASGEADAASAVEEADAATSDGTDAAAADAAVAVVADAGDGDAAVDAGPADSGPPPLECDDGEMPCGDRCIDTIAPTAAAVHQRVFAISCGLSNSCHRGSAAKEGLDLQAVDGLLTTAVGQPSAQRPELSIIEPGDPESSYLIHKLRDMDIAELSSSGEPTSVMPPPPSETLCDEKIQVVEQWIANGANAD